VGESTCTGRQFGVERTLDELLEMARALDPPAPHERNDVLRSEAAILLDGLIAQAGRGSGAIEVAIGEALAALAGRVEHLGYVSIGDYAVEVLGIAASTAAKLERRARYLRDRPLLRQAVWLGEVDPSNADAVMAVARGDDEASWVERAKVETVRALREAVKLAGGEVEEDDEERWERVYVQLAAEQRADVDAAVAIARKIVGAATLQWRCVEMLLQEFASAHACDESGKDVVLHEQIEEWIEPVKKHFEEETAEWAFFDRVGPIVAPVPSAPALEDAWSIDAELRRLNHQRKQLDEVLGRAASIFRMLGLWREAKFVSFAHYCAERARRSVRAIEQRIALERKLHGLPLLREAMREGRISYEKLRLVARAADERTEAQWINYASQRTCVELRRELDGEVRAPPAQMSAPAGAAAPATPQISARSPAPPAVAAAIAQMSARTDLDLRMPACVRELLEAAIRAVRRLAGRFLPPGECLRRIARHFIDTWKAAVRQRSTVRTRVRARDGNLCQVRGCSRAAAHAHHIVPRSRGGTDDPENLVSLCAAHHLRIVHMGLLRIHGTAPDRLTWELGERPEMMLGPGGPQPMTA
jgi:HNH endonuclease